MSDETPTERPATREPWQALARAALRREPTPPSPELLHELVVVMLDGDPYAIPVERVREIVRLRPVTPMPRVPAGIRGVISLRGEVIQVIDLRIRLGLGAASPDRHSRIVVLHGRDAEAAGLLVDSVRDVLRTPDASLREPTGGGSAIAALCVWGPELLSVLDVDRVLDFGAAD